MRNQGGSGRVEFRFSGAMIMNYPIRPVTMGEDAGVAGLSGTPLYFQI